MTCGYLVPSAIRSISPRNSPSPIPTVGLPAASTQFSVWPNGSALNAGTRPFGLFVPHCRIPIPVPLLLYAFDIHTYAGLPVNIPMPPRSCCVCSELMSQLNPTRGFHRSWPDGTSGSPKSVLTCAA